MEGGQLDQKRNVLELENRLKMLWERFATAIKPVGPTSNIVVANHSHPALTSTYLQYVIFQGGLIRTARMQSDKLRVCLIGAKRPPRSVIRHSSIVIPPGIS
jgi:hypothetical protein